MSSSSSPTSSTNNLSSEILSPALLAKLTEMTSGLPPEVQEEVARTVLFNNKIESDIAASVSPGGSLLPDIARGDKAVSEPLSVELTLSKMGAASFPFTRLQSTLDRESQFDSVELPAERRSLTHFRPHVLSELPTLEFGDEASAFTTISVSGQVVDDGNSNEEQLRWTRSDGKDDGRDGTPVTFAFDDQFDLGGISTARGKELFIAALETWATYSPIDFQQVSDPGSGDAVDIFVESRSIDGPNRTLAYAFFPQVGDITFDADEDWSQERFVETALHEIGHALGLAHEEEEEAILNPVLANRFNDPNNLFLLEDDIEGIRSLYGTGAGSVAILAEFNSPPSPPSNSSESSSQTNDSNLVVNGSFEVSTLNQGQTRIYNSIEGWSQLSGAGFLVDKQGGAAAGEAFVELDADEQNSTIAQNVDTVTGQVYTIQLDYTNGGRNFDSTGIAVFWEGQKIDTLTGGGSGNWDRYTYQVVGGSRSVSTLAFAAVGDGDSVGGWLDNITVTAGSTLTAIAPGTDQRLGSQSQDAGRFLNPLSDNGSNINLDLILAADPLPETGLSGLV